MELPDALVILLNANMQTMPRQHDIPDHIHVNQLLELPEFKGYEVKALTFDARATGWVLVIQKPFRS